MCAKAISRQMKNWPTLPIETSEHYNEKTNHHRTYRLNHVGLWWFGPTAVSRANARLWGMGEYKIMFGNKRLSTHGPVVFYREIPLCVCHDTKLCDRYEAADMIAALFNEWLDTQDKIHEGLRQQKEERK